MTRLLALVSASLLGLAACAGPKPDAAPVALTPSPAETAAAAPATVAPTARVQAGPEDALSLPVAYACAGGTGFEAIYPADGRTVTVTAAGRSRTLDLVAGAAAPTFRRDGVELAALGAGATLTGGGLAFTGCQAG